MSPITILPPSLSCLPRYSSLSCCPSYSLKWTPRILCPARAGSSVCAPCTASTTQANAGPQLLLGALFMVLIWAAAAVVFLSPQYVGISVMALTTVLSFQLFLHIRLKSQAGLTFFGGVCVFAQINARMRSSIRTPASVVQPCMCLCRCNRYRADSYEGRLTLLMQ